MLFVPDDDDGERDDGAKDLGEGGFGRGAGPLAPEVSPESRFSRSKSSSSMIKIRRADKSSIILSSVSVWCDGDGDAVR